MRPEEVGIYLYCIAEGPPIAAEDGLGPVRPGYSLAHEDLLAVVSQVPLEEFGEAALPTNLQDAGWLEREVRAHERVIEEVMAGRTVLPMRFCTIFHSEEKVRALLETHCERFRRALARLRGRAEWEIRLYHEPTTESAAEAPQPAAGSPGTAYLVRKGALERAAQEAASEARRQAQRTLAALADQVDQIQLKPVAPQGSQGAPRLVLDAVCLLAQPRLAAFHRQLEEVAKDLTASGLRLRLSGPWPPYHFSAELQERVGVP